MAATPQGFCILRVEPDVLPSGVGDNAGHVTLDHNFQLNPIYSPAHIQALNGLAPPYFTDLLETYFPQPQLRSSSKSMLVVPKTITLTSGRQGFGRVSPVLWNGCPEMLKNAQTVF